MQKFVVLTEVEDGNLKQSIGLKLANNRPKKAFITLESMKMFHNEHEGLLAAYWLDVPTTTKIKIEKGSFVRIRFLQAAFGQRNSFDRFNLCSHLFFSRLPHRFSILNEQFTLLYHNHFERYF